MYFDKNYISNLIQNNDLKSVAASLNLISHKGRFFCPTCQPDGFDGGHKTPDLALYTNRWKCFKCGKSGDVITLTMAAMNCSFQEAIVWLSKKSTFIPIKINKKIDKKKESTSNSINNLNDVLSKMEVALPGSLGEKYLFSRGISLSLAKKYRIGYSHPGTWLNKYRDWKYGRLVFPHTNLNGDIISLYSRTVDINCDAPKEIRHDHLSGKKGYFNARALFADTVFICEGVFDCMSLIAAGHENSTAIFGVTLKWDLVKANKVVFCFDLDDTGSNQYRLAALDGLLYGKEIFSIPSEIYSGCKDINEAWVKNNNQLGKPPLKLMLE